MLIYLANSLYLVFQMLLLIAVSVLLVVLAIIKIRGVGALAASTPDSYWQLLQPLGHKDFPWLAIILGYPVMGIWFWCTDQSMVQSVLGAKSLKEGQKGANFLAWLKLIDIPLFILPGILAFVLIPNLTNSTDAYLQLVKHIFPPGLIGLVVVVMIAALVSTVGSALNSLSTVFTMDIYLKNKTNVNAKRIKRIGRVVVLIGSLLSVFLAVGISLIQGLSFFNIFQSVLGFIAPPMSVAFLAAVLWKKTSHRSINLVLSIGTIFSIGIGLLYYTGLILSGIHFLYISFAIFVLLGIFVIIFTLRENRTTEMSVPQPETMKIDYSVKWAWGLLIVVMVAMYLIFN